MSSAFATCSRNVERNGGRAAVLSSVPAFSFASPASNNIAAFALQAPSDPRMLSAQQQQMQQQQQYYLAALQQQQYQYQLQQQHHLAAIQAAAQASLKAQGAAAAQSRQNFASVRREQMPIVEKTPKKRKGQEDSEWDSAESKKQTPITSSREKRARSCRLKSDVDICDVELAARILFSIKEKYEEHPNEAEAEEFVEFVESFLSQAKLFKEHEEAQNYMMLQVQKEQQRMLMERTILQRQQQQQQQQQQQILMYQEMQRQMAEAYRLQAVQKEQEEQARQQLRAQTLLREQQLIREQQQQREVEAQMRIAQSLKEEAAQKKEFEDNASRSRVSIHSLLM